MEVWVTPGPVALGETTGPNIAVPSLPVPGGLCAAFANTSVLWRTPS